LARTARPAASLAHQRVFFPAIPPSLAFFLGLVISTPLPLSRRCELRLPAMCDAGEDAPAAEEEPPAASVLDSLSGVPAEVLDPRSGILFLYST